MTFRRFWYRVDRYLAPEKYVLRELRAENERLRADAGRLRELAEGLRAVTEERRGIYVGVDGRYRCLDCLDVLFGTDALPTDCTDEHCGEPVPPLSDEMQEHARKIFEEMER